MSVPPPPHRRMLADIEKHRFAVMILAISFLLIIGIIAHAMIYYELVFVNYPVADDYRLILFHVKPWLDNTWTFAQLWEDVHPLPLLGIAYLFSLKVDALTFVSWWYLIAFGMLLKWAGFAFLAIRNSSLDFNRSCLLTVGMAICVFSFNTTVHFTWNVLGITEVFHALTAIYLIAFGHFFTRNSRSDFLWFLGFSLIFQLSFRSLAIFWFAALLVPAGLYMIFDRRAGSGPFLRFSSIIIIALVVDKLFFSYLGLEHYFESRSSTALSDFYNAWSARPVELIFYVAAAATSGFVSLSHLSKSGWSEYSQSVLCLAYFGVYLWAMIMAAFRSRTSGYRLALAMMLFPMLSLAGILLYRADESTQWYHAAVPRYVLIRQIGTMGFVWVLVQLACEGGLSKIHRKTASVLSIAVVGMMIGLQYSYAQYEWKSRLGSVQKNNELNLRQVVFTGNTISKYSHMNGAQIKWLYEKQYSTPYRAVATINIGDNPLNTNHKLQTLLLLKQHSLNVFNENFTVRAKK